MVERFVNYLETFDITQLQKLFGHVDVSIAVFRSLMPLERQVVMRLLFLHSESSLNSKENNDIDGCINTAMFEKWTENVETSNNVTRRLVQLGILEVISVGTSAAGVVGVDVGVGNNNSIVVGDQVRLCRAFANSVSSLVLGTDQNNSNNNNDNNKRLMLF